MPKEEMQPIQKPKSQIEVDQFVLDFLGDMPIKTPEDLVRLRAKILSALENRPYNNETREHADGLQWKRTASDILRDGYIYDGKACSDLVVVFLAACKARGIEGNLVKMVTFAGDKTHSIVEVKLEDDWYRLDPSMPDFPPRPGQMTDELLREDGWKIWKKGKDLWELGLNEKDDERKVCK